MEKLIWFICDGLSGAVKMQGNPVETVWETNEGQFHDWLTGTSNEEVYHYWRAHFDGDLLPDRAAIDPLDIALHMSNVYLMDVLGSGGADGFRNRLFGTELVTVVGMDATGKTLAEGWPGERGIELARQHEEVVQRGEANLTRFNLFYPNREYVATQRMLLPLRYGGQSVGILMGHHHFFGAKI